MVEDKGNTIIRKAYAKINLALDVIRRREDGYHEVRMIMQTIGLYDVLTFTMCKSSGITVLTDKEELPGDESNLIYKAAKLIIEKYAIQQGVRIELQKNIPMAAGMAGGSTDAAAVFHGMNELFGLGCSLLHPRRNCIIGRDWGNPDKTAGCPHLLCADCKAGYQCVHEICL